MRQRFDGFHPGGQAFLWDVGPMVPGAGVP